MYIAPSTLSLQSYVELEQNLSYMMDDGEKTQNSRQNASVTSSTASPATPTHEDLSVVLKATEIVLRDLRASSLKARGMVAVCDELDTGIPDAREFVLTRFPKTYVAMLAGCSGKKYVMQPPEDGEFNASIPGVLERLCIAGHSGGGMNLLDKQGDDTG